MKSAVLLAFLSSFCLMVLELVAGRMMAPYLGVSLYTWTSVIGVILGGLSLGAYIGGMLADRRPTRQTLSTLFFFSGLTALFIVYLSPLFGSWSGHMRTPFIVSTLLFSLIAFFLPALFLGTIAPVLVKLQLHTLEKTGSTVGQLSASGALGSIAGTFLTGFVFIPLFGTKIIVIGVAILLIMIGFLIVGHQVISRWLKTLSFLLLIGTAFLPNVCTKESQYYCVRVDRVTDGYRLRLDYITHGYVYPQTPNNLGAEYMKAFALLLNDIGRGDFKTALIGGGAYVLPRYIEAEYPKAEAVVIEIDPAVTDVNHDQLELSRATKIKTVNQDARIFFARESAEQKYDAIFGDAFNDLSVPHHLVTIEFTSSVKSHLTEKGFYAVNIIDDPTRGRFLASFIRTFQEIFPYVTLIPMEKDWQIHQGNNFVLVGSLTSLDTSIFSSTFSSKLEPVQTNFRTVSGSELEEFVARNRGIVLTDDYAPVEAFLANVFLYTF